MRNIKFKISLVVIQLILGIGCVSPGLKRSLPLVYRVKIEKGDTVANIARKYRTTPAAIIARNHLKNKNYLSVGQEILVRPNYKILKSKSSSKFLSSYTVPKGKARLSWPAKGWLSSKFGMRWGRLHGGIDIAASLGTEVQAAHSGKVSFVGWKRGYGRTVILNHGHFKTLYAHLHRYSVRRGQTVVSSQKIGAVGRSGNARGVHLHFEYRDQENRPKDPMAYLPSRRLISMR